ncbi:hypothetical protein LTR28_008688 [Elasticomyces elasticus]|nr:hypothetical protein LTR28_008688 [Elasticomyces elasticus]
MEKRLRVWDIERASNGNFAAPTNGHVESSTNGDTNSVGHEIGHGTHEGTLKSIVWSHDPNVLTTASDDRKVRWWDLRSRSAVSTYSVDGLIGSCELNDTLSNSSTGSTSTPNGVLSVAAGKSVYFFDGGRPGQLIKSVKMQHDVASVAFNGDVGSGGRYVTGGSGDTWVRVWDYETEQELDFGAESTNADVKAETGKGHHGPVWTVSFSPDGKLYATGSEDGTIKLWKFTAGPYGLWR